MKSHPRSQPELSDEELRILQVHWEWTSRYAILSIIIGLVIMGGAFVIFEYLGVDEKARIPSLILLATLILINVIWRAAGAVAGRIELILRKRPIDVSAAGGGDQGRV